MGEEERYSCLGWQLLLPGQARRLQDLFAAFGSARAAFTASVADLAPVLGRRQAEELVKRREMLDVEGEIKKLKQAGARFVTLADDGYPALLRKTFDPPAALFYHGELPAEEPAVAVVGTRRCSSYGQLVAERLGRELAEAGVTVVSGLARGIDTAAHRGALAGGGRTVAVLGTGLDICYPAVNRRLMKEIAAKGAVVSEFPLGMFAEPWHFPVRNRIIAGLSRAVVVVEAKERSGALITADLALEQGREVMAVPGNITSPFSRGPNSLLKQGAHPVTDAVDVLEAIGLKGLFSKETQGKPVLDQLEASLLSLLSGEPLSQEALIQRAGAPASKVLSGLVFLELKGLVRSLPGGLYTVGKPVSGG
ncbi:MAG: DNA-processing protein DprA [Bacillota bacterium]